MNLWVPVQCYNLQKRIVVNVKLFMNHMYFGQLLFESTQNTSLHVKVLHSMTYCMEIIICGN